MIDRLLAVVCVGASLGCSAPGEHYGPPEQGPPRNPSGPAASSGRQDQPSPVVGGSVLDRAAEAVLLVSARTSVESFLGATHVVVEDAEGRVVAGAHEETSSPETSQYDQDDGELSLQLPAGSDYTLRLSATTADPHPTTCRTSVGPLSLVGGATARVQILAWDCGDHIGYVPEALENDCYWLADWAFVGRTRAAVGQHIEGGVMASAPARYRWSSASPELGSFSAPDAAQTAFRCEAPGDELALEVVLSDAACDQRVTQIVSCF